MPIVDVEMVMPGDHSLARALVLRLADAVGQALGSAPGQTWVRLRTLPLKQYAENGGGPPAGVLPVFVTVLRAKRPEAAAFEAEVRRVVAEVSRVLDRPAENVHVIYEAESSGRIAFGGRTFP